jgi:hypothetical protein
MLSGEVAAYSINEWRLGTGLAPQRFLMIRSAKIDFMIENGRDRGDGQRKKRQRQKLTNFAFPSTRNAN